MISRIPVPDGCGAIKGDGVILIGPEQGLAELETAGLHRLEGWGGTAGRQGSGPGRGAVVSLELPSGRRIVLKQLRRGGMLARFRDDRFRYWTRLLGNLTLPLELADRGVETAIPAGLLVLDAGSGMYQGWLATEEIPDTCDGLTWLETSTESGPGLLDPALRFVRDMHDAGLQHRDLNLGNLLIRHAGDAVGKVAVIDLDGARLHDGSLPFHLRMISLWRLERSMVKRFDGGGPLGERYRSSWAAAYAAGDERMARRILRWWSVGRILLAAHRAGW